MVSTRRSRRLLLCPCCDSVCVRGGATISEGDAAGDLKLNAVVGCGQTPAMEAPAIIQYITDTFAGIQIARSDDGANSFFYYSADGKVREKTLPCAALVTKDDYDTVSNLSRPSVCRLN